MRVSPLVVAATLLLSGCGAAGFQTQGQGQVRIVGPEEIVFDWTTQRCENEDIPDLAARAFRDITGTVQLLASHSRTRRMTGATLDTVVRDCTPVMASHGNADPAMYDDQEWLAAPYTEDGATVHALVHNEYQGNTHPGQCPSGLYEDCWYNAITSAFSRDSGRSYAHPAPPPGHLVASLPYRYVPFGRRTGYFMPTNIVRNQADGFFYAMLEAPQRDLQEAGVCVIRTRTLADPTSWRAWNGSGFAVQFINPYLNQGADPAQHVCKPVAVGSIGQMVGGSLVFSTHYNRFLLVGIEQRNGVWGFYYSLSGDLVNWTPMALAMWIRPPWIPGPGDGLHYPSLLDPQDTTRNFERITRRPYLYFVRMHGGLDRDLVRVRVEFP